MIGTPCRRSISNSAENSGEVSVEEPKKKRGFLNSVIEIITKSITPILGILTAAGLLQGILALLTVTKVLDTSDGAYIVLHAMGQTAFYFLPVILGYTSAKAFRLNPFVGMILGATLVDTRINVRSYERRGKIYVVSRYDF